MLTLRIKPCKDNNILVKMTKLSVNINKIATLRNARGGNNPDVVKVVWIVKSSVQTVLLCILVQMNVIFVGVMCMPCARY